MQSTKFITNRHCCTYIHVHVYTLLQLSFILCGMVFLQTNPPCTKGIHWYWLRRTVWVSEWETNFEGLSEVGGQFNTEHRPPFITHTQYRVHWIEHHMSQLGSLLLDHCVCVCVCDMVYFLSCMIARVYKERERVSNYVQHCWESNVTLEVWHVRVFNTCT